MSDNHIKYWSRQNIGVTKNIADATSLCFQKCLLLQGGSLPGRIPHSKVPLQLHLHYSKGY